MLVLAVNIDQHFAEGFHVAERCRRAVDKALRPAVFANNAAQYAAIRLVIIGQFVRRQPGYCRLNGGDVEQSADFGLTCTAAHNALVGSIA